MAWVLWEWEDVDVEDVAGDVVVDIVDELVDKHEHALES